MHSITLKSHIGSDGLLKVHLPNMRDTDVEVVIVYQTSLSSSTEAASLSQFYGCIQDAHFPDNLNLNSLSAAIALANHLTLVTHNTGEFGRVEELQVEDWEIEM